MTDSSDATMLVLVADPGLPAELARRLADELPSTLDERGDGRWAVRISGEPVALDEGGGLPMLQIGERVRDSDQRADAVVLLTDLPRRAGTRPVVADGGTRDRVGLVSLPALGALDQYRRVRETVVNLVTRHLLPARDGGSVGEGLNAGSAGTLIRLDPDRGAANDSGTGAVEDGVDVRLALSGWRGRARLLSGLVRANRPWRLVPSLSPAIAAAVAGAAFGIFYSNIWQLSDAMGVTRQLILALVALVAMTGWLVVDHGLWESRRSRELREEMLLSNASTVLTVGTGVLIMYGMLIVITLAAAALVIPPSYLGQQLERESGLGDYLLIALLSSSMGTVAGALGSGFADDSAVRQAAYSRREQERRARQDREDEHAHG